MNCLEQTQTLPTIIQGQDMSLNVRLVGDSGDPVDLTSATEIVAVFPTTLIPLYLEKRLSLNQIVMGSATGGRFLILAPPTDTKLITPGNQISFEVRITLAGKVSVVQFPQSLNVVASLFPDAI